MIPAWRLTTCLLLLSAVVMPVCAQQVYKWTDANGQVHFSDQPPPGAASSAEVVGEKSKIAPAPRPQPAPVTIDTAPDQGGPQPRLAEPAQPAPDPMVEAERKLEELCAGRAAQQLQADRKLVEQCKANHETYCNDGVDGIRRAEFARDMKAHEQILDAKRRGQWSGRVPEVPQYIPPGTKTFESQMDPCTKYAKKKR
jgi:hypothetical protein